tara:strand:+ start:1151 stop:1639 length:489 start_codon:yes stop_codon:yes gene_type:complete
MLNKDSVLLEKAYLAVKRPMVQVPSDEREEDEVVLTREDEIVDTAPVTEPAPNVTVGTVAPAASADVMTPGDAMSGGECHWAEEGCDCDSCEHCRANQSEMEHDCDEEDEEHGMALDNLNSIRESIMKIAGYCAQGHSLEPWQHQKLAIVMDGLASVARSCY